MDEGLSMGTPVSGYFRLIPEGRREEPEGRWLGFVLSHPCRKVHVNDGVPPPIFWMQIPYFLEFTSRVAL